MTNLYRALLLAVVCCAPLAALAESFFFEVCVLEGSGIRLPSKRGEELHAKGHRGDQSVWTGRDIREHEPGFRQRFCRRIC